MDRQDSNSLVGFVNAAQIITKKKKTKNLVLHRTSKLCTHTILFFPEPLI